MNNAFKISIGIDPAGIGSTGIVIKTYGGLFPKKWTTTIKADNPVESADKIITWINSKIKTIPDFNITEVVCELPHNGNEKFKEIKATRELVGILRFYYRTKFFGHLPNHKDKEIIKTSKLKTSHERDAEAILFAHWKEKNEHFICQNYLWGDKKW